MRIKLNKHIYENGVSRLSFVFTWTIIMLFATNIAGVLENLTGIPYQIISNIGKITILLLLVCNVRILIQRIRPKEALILAFMMSLMIINYLATENNPYVGSTISSFVMTVLPMILIMISVDNYDSMLTQLSRISPPIIIVSVILLFIAGRQINQYSMGLSSALVIPILVVLLNFYYTKRITSLLISLAGIFVIVILGSRGALLGIGVFGIALLLRGVISKENRAKSILMILIIFIVLLGYNVILEWVMDIMTKFGWQSRTIYLLVNDIHHDSGRGYIYESMLTGIGMNPFAIQGIAGEYNYTGQYYAHNLFLELLCDFGVIIGGIASLFVIVQAIKTIWKSVTAYSNANDLKLIMLMASVPMLFVSGTIWKTVYFWTWLFAKDIDVYTSKNERREDQYYEIIKHCSSNEE